jgi:hypothetical protein
MKHIAMISCPKTAGALPEDHTPAFFLANLPDSLMSLVQLIVHHVKALNDCDED